MTRIFQEPELCIATSNQGKIKEFQALFSGYPFKVTAAADRVYEKPPEETGYTYLDNAVIKAKYYAQKTGLPCLADDSGLSVLALDGAPGVYSARLAGEEKDFKKAQETVREQFEAKSLQNPNVTNEACFVCVLALCWPDGHIEHTEGRIHGELVFPGRGMHGFGYDPIFIPHGYKETFSEISPEIKNKISHRALAFQRLITLCFTS